MNYTYKFADGSSTEIEISEILMAEINELEREEYNNNQRETRRHVSLEAFNLDDGLFASNLDIEAELERKEQITRLYTVFQSLSPTQRTLVKRVYFQQEKLTDIANKDGVSKTAITNRLKKIHLRIEKLF